MKRRATLAVIAAGAAVALGAGVAVGVSTLSRDDATASALPSGVAEASVLATAYLDDWVEDGRVIRRDEGGDTVSEGQAYGLFAALLADDEESFDAVWTWTKDELMRPDGLLAWQWRDGAVVDGEPASDADLDAARALVVAGERFDRPDLSEEGRTLGGAILDELTAQTEAGRILLPGLWAKSAPHMYNPSYSSPAAYAILADATGDERWDELAEGSSAVTATLLDAVDLPPDWAQVQPDGRIDPMAGADGRGEVQYGFDAARLGIRYAESCAASDTAAAAGLHPTLAREDDLPARLDLGGSPLSDEQAPLAYAARAAAAASAGEASAAHRDLARAGEVAREFPTYYGASWALLGVGMLATDRLGRCPPLAGGDAAAQNEQAPWDEPAQNGAAHAVDAGGLQDPQISEAPDAASPPVRVRIPSLGVDAALEDLGLEEDGELEAPVQFADAGWYSDGVAPGDVGPAIIAGHVDSRYGPAVFYRLSELRPGDPIIVTRADGTEATFSVTRSEQAEKSTFPTSEVYHNVPRPELRLITCAGVFDSEARDYSDNLVVFADLA